jgi:tRNA G37 N-methylase Trm5
MLPTKTLAKKEILKKISRLLVKKSFQRYGEVRAVLNMEERMAKKKAKKAKKAKRSSAKRKR